VGTLRSAISFKLCTPHIWPNKSILGSKVCFPCLILQPRRSVTHLRSNHAQFWPAPPAAPAAKKRLMGGGKCGCKRRGSKSRISTARCRLGRPTVSMTIPTRFRGRWVGCCCHGGLTPRDVGTYLQASGYRAHMALACLPLEGL
jgi:hypothetical protein